MEPMGIERHRWEKPRGRMSGSERVKITDEVRKYAESRGSATTKPLERGLKGKSAEFVERGAELYAKA
jgi:hypothetical protein